MRRVVLASASPRRRELLAALIDDYDIVPADIPEPLTANPREDALSLAIAKAKAVAATYPSAIVIGSDTIVHLADRSFGKPVDALDAVRMLTALRGRTHTVSTGVAIVSSEGPPVAAVIDASVELAALPDAAIATYVAGGRPLDKAGAYAIQDDDVPTVARFEGCYCSVMGLPLYWLKRRLEHLDVRCNDPATTRAVCRACPMAPPLGSNS
jgi:septum formation protein